MIYKVLLRVSDEVCEGDTDPIALVIGELTLADSGECYRLNVVVHPAFNLRFNRDELMKSFVEL